MLIDATIVRMVLVPSVMELSVGRTGGCRPGSTDIVPTLGVEVDAEPEVNRGQPSPPDRTRMLLV